MPSGLQDLPAGAFCQMLAAALAVAAAAGLSRTFWGRMQRLWAQRWWAQAPTHVGCFDTWTWTLSSSPRSVLMGSHALQAVCVAQCRFIMMAGTVLQVLVAHALVANSELSGQLRCLRTSLNGYSAEHQQVSTCMPACQALQGAALPDGGVRPSCPCRTCSGAQLAVDWLMLSPTAALCLHADSAVNSVNLVCNPPHGLAVQAVKRDESGRRVPQAWPADPTFKWRLTPEEASMTAVLHLHHRDLRCRCLAHPRIMFSL
jgi:hypothetical protein